MIYIYNKHRNIKTADRLLEVLDILSDVFICVDETRLKYKVEICIKLRYNKQI